MVPVEWPVAAAREGGGAVPARVAGGSRLPTVRLDFFLDPQARLTEQERALMSGMLTDLVDSIGDELKSALGGFEPANDDGGQLAQRLRRSGLLDIADLVRLLLHRAEEERISTALLSGRGGKSRFLQPLVSDENSDVSAAAMALILARGRRRDRFGGPRVLFDDLSAEAAASLVAGVAAAIRGDLVKRLDAADADERLADAGQSVLSTHDEGNRLEARLFDLVHALGEDDRLDERFIRSAIEEGEVSLLTEALGRSAGIAFQPAWEHLTGGPGELALLLRMSGASRALAGDVIARAAEVVGTDPESEIAAFDSLSDEDVDSARRWLRLDPAYRSAIETMAWDRGQRSV